MRLLGWRVSVASIPSLRSLRWRAMGPLIWGSTLPLLWLHPSLPWRERKKRNEQHFVHATLIHGPASSNERMTTAGPPRIPLRNLLFFFSCASFSGTGSVPCLAVQRVKLTQPSAPLQPRGQATNPSGFLRSRRQAAGPLHPVPVMRRGGKKRELSFR